MVTKKVPKITKIEWLLLALTAVFLTALGCIAARNAPAREGTAVFTARQSGLDVTPDPPGPVDVNAAGSEELESLPGIGPALAERIVEYREENGPFESLDELTEVRGIGEKTLEGLRDKAVAGGGSAAAETTEEPAA